MNLTPMGSNKTELKLNDWFVFFSYRTPVAAIDRRTGKAYRTEKKWSVTTSKHITQYFQSLNKPDAANVELKPQEFFDKLVA